MSGVTLALMLVSLAAIGAAIRGPDNLRSQSFGTPGEDWDVCDSVQCPRYNSVHKGGGFEVRLYGDATWVETSDIPTGDFSQAKMLGEILTMYYFFGQNSRKRTLPATAPIVTTARPRSGPFDLTSFSVRALIPPRLIGHPPKPDSSHLSLINITGHCAVVAPFPGSAFSVDQEVRQLAAALQGTPWEDVPHANPSSPYAVAEYVNLKDIPFVPALLHEIWFPFVASRDDCIPDNGGRSAM